MGLNCGFKWKNSAEYGRVDCTRLIVLRERHVEHIKTSDGRMKEERGWRDGTHS